MVMAAVERVVVNVTRSTPPWFSSESARVGRQLEELRGNDYSSMTAEMRAVFRAYKRLPPLRYFAVISKACTDLAQHLDRERVYDLPTALTGPARAIVERWMRDFPVTSDIEQAGVAQQSYAILYHPDPERPTELMQTHVLGYQLISVEWASSLGRCEDLRRASRVRFAVPARLYDREKNRADTVQLCSIVEITPAYAHITLPDGQRQGLLAPDGSNPLGYVPMVGRRRARPADRLMWIPEPAWDLQTCAVGAILGMSDKEHMTRVMAPGLLVAKGPGAKRLRKDLEVQPGSLLAVDNEDVTLEWLQGNPPVEMYGRMIDRALDLCGSLRYLRKGELSGITGDAKEQELGGLHAANDRQGVELLRFDRDNLDLFCEAYNAFIPRAQKLPTEIGHELAITYRYSRPRQNVLQEAQAITVAASIGLADVVKEVAVEEGVSLEKAEGLVKDRLKFFREIMPSGNTPGMNRIADQVSKPLTQTNQPEAADAQGQAREAASGEG